AFVCPFLGILPVRDDPEPGEEVRYVFPKSPAEASGLKPGDRILKVGDGEESTTFSGRDELTAILNHLLPGVEIKLEVTRKESKKTETIKVTLGTLSEEVPAKLSGEASRGKALTPRKAAAPPPVLGPGRAAPPKPPTPKKEDEKKDEKKE